MARKQTPYEAFNDNISDAEALMNYARAFRNKRQRRMRRELRSNVGEALKLSDNQQDHLDCLESDDVFMVFLPGSTLTRDQFEDLRPLLRQSLVAACAAFETYVADKAMNYVGGALSASEIPTKLQGISLTVGRWIDIEENYKRRSWGIRSIVEDHIRLESSTAPKKVGEVLAVIGVTNWARQIDVIRKVPRGTTVEELHQINRRRNHIAHTADRQGQGRAAILLDDVQRYISVIQDVVNALENLLESHRVR